MRTQDLVNNMQSGQSVAPAAKTATFNGSSVDFRDCGPEVTVLQNVGVVSGTTPTMDTTLEESNDNSTFTAIPGFAMTQVTTSTHVEMKRCVNRTKRYVRPVVTIAGTTPSFQMAITLLGDKTSY